jgi:hypothetical protein
MASAFTQMSPNVCQAGTVGWLVESIFFVVLEELRIKVD